MRRIVAMVVVALVVGVLPPLVTAAEPSPQNAPSAEPAPISVPSEPAPVEEPSGPATDGVAADEPSTTLDTVATTTDFILTSTVGVVGYAKDFRIQTNPTATGTVDLVIDGSVVATGTYPANDSNLTLTWTPPAAGEYAAQAVYGGSEGFAPSSSAILDVYVVLPTPYVAVTVSNEWPQFGEVVDFTATVTPDPGSGTIEWLVDDVVAASGPLEPGGLSHFSTSFSTPYLHSVKARFGGNDAYQASTGNRNIHLAPLPSTVTISMPPSPIPAGPVTATVTVSPNPGGGTLTWRTIYLGGATTPVDPDGTTDILLGDLDPRVDTLLVSFGGYGQYGPSSAELGFRVVNAAGVSIAANRSSAWAGELPVVLTATVAPFTWGGTVTFLDDVAGSVLELGPVEVSREDGTATFSSSGLRVGTHSIRARFNGVDGAVAPATSEPITITILADTSVHATFKPSSATFYPYKEGYRDTVSLGGVLDERATVTVRVYSSTGSLKRTFSLGTRGPGSYSATWNGRTASGTAVKAGKYTVRASFKDARGNTRTISGYTTVSWRQAAWKTATTVLRYGDQFTYYATPGDHLYYSDDYSRGRVMYSAYINSSCAPNCDIVYGLTTFSLRSTALAYRRVNLTVTGHTFVDYNSGTAMFVRWSDGLPQARGGLPEYKFVPITYTASSGHISADRKLRFIAWCTEDMGDAFDLHYVRLNYQYAVWK